MFQPVNSRANFPQMEDRVLAFWKENHIFEKSVKAREGNPRFVFYEGPPFANGNPGIHHVLARAYKDVIVRYKVMKGYHVPRIGGWDTHGLPVELEVEKQLGLSGKDQIEKYGVANFNQRSRESVFKYLKEWNTLTERIAYWVDLDNAYKTMDNTYVESVWWAVKELWEKGLIYQGYKVTPHCPRCGTSLSSHEVALGYQDDTADPSVFVKFHTHAVSDQQTDSLAQLRQLAAQKPAYLLAWTTTPWTLPGNTALAVAPGADYAVVAVDDEYLIFADALRNQVGLGDNPVVMRLPGRDLAGLEYEPLYNPHDYGVERRRFDSMTELSVQPADPDLTYKVIPTDFVSMEDGTGIVHVAPAFGEVDFQAGQEHQLNVVHNVDPQGKIVGNYPFAGKFVKKADPLILDDLKSRGLLFKSGTIKHTYPFCWRCDAPLLYYAKQTWYIRTTAVKDKMVESNKTINWYPEHIKLGRFGNWLENNIDWAFARERYWGSPVPIWKCEQCGSFECVGSLESLKNKPGVTGLKEPIDLHRPDMDNVSFKCKQCGSPTKRTPEVMDCWFDSGSMPFAQLHYPFDNKKLFDTQTGQADFICEGVDQTRGWFYSLHAISTMLFDKPAYRNCICLELVLDAQGKKMSKSKGNVVDPMKVVSDYGADALRWYCFTSAPPGMVRRFDTKMVADITRQFLLTLWNVYSFFILYANIDNFKPGTPPVELPELDRWILSELHQLTDDVTNATENYDPTTAGRRIETFVDNLSNWYVRRSRRRFWKSESDTDKLAAYHTLYECLVTLSKLLAPFAPYVAEEIYQNLVRSLDLSAPLSVHLADFPVADKSKIDRELSANTLLAMRISSLGRAARSQAGIKVRQPLATAFIKVASPREEAGMLRFENQILEELNVKKLVCVATAEELNKPEYSLSAEGEICVAVPREIPPELAAEGLAREIVHRLQTMRKTAGFEIADYITTFYTGDDYVNHVINDYAAYIQQETLSRDLVEGFSGEGIYREKAKLGGYEMELGVRKEG